MGLIKNLPYTDFQNQMAIFGRAIGSPARSKLIQALLRTAMTRREMIELTSLTPNSLRNHLLILQDAGILEVEYHVHFLKFKLNREAYNTQLAMLATQRLEEECLEPQDETQAEENRLFPFWFKVKRTFEPIGLTVIALVFSVLNCYIANAMVVDNFNSA